MIPANDDLLAASRFYVRLLRLYPERHRVAFGEQMLQTFLDSYRNAARASGRVPAAFWLAVLWDEGWSIVREQASGPEGRRRVHGVLGAPLLVWSFVIVAIPPALPPAAWPVLFVPTIAWCAVFLAAPRIGGLVAKAATLVIAAGVIYLELVVGQRLNEVSDLVSPALMLICILFFVKGLAGWLPSGGNTLSVWSSRELALGLLVGAIGTLALGTGASTQADNDSLVNAVFFLLIPILSGVGGFIIGRQQTSSVAAICAAMTSFLVGAVVWVAARPALAAVAVPGTLTGWRHVITAVVLINCVFAVALAILGRLYRLRSEVLSS